MYIVVHCYRDVQCISCDENVMMKQDNTMEDMMPQSPLPAQHSVKPYLTYQLDQVRKQQKKWVLQSPANSVRTSGIIAQIFPDIDFRTEIGPLLSFPDS